MYGRNLVYTIVRNIAYDNSTIARCGMIDVVRSDSIADDHLAGFEILDYFASNGRVLHQQSGGISRCGNHISFAPALVSGQLATGGLNDAALNGDAWKSII